MRYKKSFKEDPQKENSLSRRDFLRLSGLATAGIIASACAGQPVAPAAQQAPAAQEAAPAPEEAAPDAEASSAEESSGGIPDVARENTLILMFQGDGTQFVDTGLGNPYATGATHQSGAAALWEPLFFYSAFADETIPWLATGYEYNDDFTQATITIREGAEWSDGMPFTARDVAFTLNMLRDNAPALTRSQAVKASVAEATAVDDLTVQIDFVAPRPRFLFDQLMFKFDTGIYIVPEHIYKDVDDIAAFEFYDPAQNWPLCTGPYKIIEWNNIQKFIDRRDDWWAVKTGFVEALPQVERILFVPRADDSLMVQRVVNDEVDVIAGLRPNNIVQAVEPNPKITTHTLREPPYGYMDWWPTSMWFNHEEGPFADKRMRWAISYSIDRQQMLEVALLGSGIIAELPFPLYPPLEPYFEAVKPLLEKYPTTEFNLEKAAALMEEQGYEKDSEGFWIKDGERIPTAISGWALFNDIGPIIAEQLRRAGFEADFSTPADNGTRISDGTQKIWLNGHGGSINDPFATLDFYTSKYYAPMGEPTAQNSRFQNAEYDAILEEMAATPASDPAYMDLYLAAMEIWLDNLVDAPIQHWLHRIPMNTTYWSGWPTVEDPYVNGAFWHLTFPLVLHRLVKTA